VGNLGLRWIVRLLALGASVVGVILAAQAHSRPAIPPSFPGPVAVAPGSASWSQQPVPTSQPIALAGRQHYRAARAGRIPANGSPVVGGVTLPRGHRSPGLDPTPLRMWETDGSVPNAVALAARLANAFPRTGLWPVLWPWQPGNEVSTYFNNGGNENAIGRVDVRALLRSLWAYAGRTGATVPYTTVPFGGLARGSRLRAANPFVIFSHYMASPGFDAPPYQLLLVPCRRPADALTVSGLGLTPDPGDPTNEQVSAVLRSWEDRYGAYLVQFGMGWIGTAASSPPGDYGTAMNLAKEMFAMNIPESPDETLALNADTLTTDGESHSGDAAVTRSIWQLGWS
jgi:hypothetical protein